MLFSESNIDHYVYRTYKNIIMSGFILLWDNRVSDIGVLKYFSMILHQFSTFVTFIPYGDPGNYKHLKSQKTVGGILPKYV